MAGLPAREAIPAIFHGLEFTPVAQRDMRKRITRRRRITATMRAINACAGAGETPRDGPHPGVAVLRIHRPWSLRPMASVARGTMKEPVRTIRVVRKGTGRPWRRVTMGVTKVVKPVYCMSKVSEPEEPAAWARDWKGW